MITLTVLEQACSAHSELVQLYLDKALTALNNKCEETASKATFGTVYRNGSNATLHSNDRTNAMALLALVRERPTSDLVPTAHCDWPTEIQSRLLCQVTKLVTTLLSTKKQVPGLLLHSITTCILSQMHHAV